MSRTGDHPTSSAVPPATPEEPLVTRLTFERDPLAAARATLIAAARAEARAREASAAELLGLGTPDDDVRNAASDENFSAMTLLAESTAGDFHDVEVKLAMLVRGLSEGAGDAAPRSVVHFVLATSALADMVVLRGGPVTLPPRWNVPIRSDADVAYWRAEAARADRKD